MRIFRLNSNEVGREFDLAFFQVDRIAEVDDALVMRVVYRKGKVNATGDAFVGAGVTKFFATENVGAVRGFNAENAGIQRPTRQRHNQDEPCHITTKSHARKHSISVASFLLSSRCTIRGARPVQEILVAIDLYGMEE